MTDIKMLEEQRNARKKAMRILERMDRTEKSLKDKLKQSGFSEEAAEDAAEYMKEFGYIDDFRYAENYILSRIHEKSKQRIMQELYQKGVCRAVAAEAWESICELEQPDERQMLRRAVEKKYPPGTEIDEKEMRRLYGYLARRGFRAEDIVSVIEVMNIRVPFE
ncbi:MAG TPA: recombination regulator RecX [Candidatus Blautia excrementipullorum]|nr:recombination regulator RecX [Candidatus Blautia excrementipullorum]